MIWSLKLGKKTKTMNAGPGRLAPHPRLSHLRLLPSNPLQRRLFVTKILRHQKMRKVLTKRISDRRAWRLRFVFEKYRACTILGWVIIMLKCWNQMVKKNKTRRPKCCLAWKGSKYSRTPYLHNSLTERSEEPYAIIVFTSNCNLVWTHPKNPVGNDTYIGQKSDTCGARKYWFNMNKQAKAFI